MNLGVIGVLVIMIPLLVVFGHSQYAPTVLEESYQEEVDNAECYDLSILLDQSRKNFDRRGEPTAYNIIRSEYLERCNEELPINTDYFQKTIYNTEEYMDKLMESGQDRSYSLPYDHLKNIDKFKNTSSLGWCINNNWEGYDADEQRCYYDYDSRLNGYNKIFASEIESSYDLTKQAMRECFAKGGGWEQGCYYPVGNDERWCNPPYELWSPTNSQDDATCYGDSSLDQLRAKEMLK